MDTETNAAAGKLAPLVYGQAPRAPQPVNMGRGIMFTVKPLDAITHARLMSLAVREVDALVRGAETRRVWGFQPDQIAALAEDSEAQNVILGWIRAVLIAEAAVVSVEGVVNPDGSPVAPSFEFFVWILGDPEYEARFEFAALATERMYVAEGNASGRGPNGSGATASTTAPDAAPSTNLAPEAASPSTQTDSPPGDALNSNMPPEPISATSPGASAPDQAASGAAPE